MVERMNNQLIKNTKTTYIPGSPGYPAFAGQPWIPAHTTVTPYTVLEAQYGTSRVFIKATPGGISSQGASQYGTNAQYVYDADGNITGFWYYMSNVFLGYKPVTRYAYTYYPEQPYMPPTPAVAPVASQTIIDLNLGWNSSGGSLAALHGQGWFEFRPATISGAFVGFSTEQATSGYADIEFGVYLTRGTARAYVNGTPQGAPVAYLPGDLFAVERYAGEFVLWHDNGVNSAAVYSTPSFDGSLYLVASMYSGGDAIYNPAVYSEDFFGANVSMQALASMTGNVPYGASATSLSPLGTIARQKTTTAGVLPALRSMSSNYTYADGRVTFEAFTSVSEAGMLTPGYAVAEVMIVPLMASARGLTGENGQSSAPLGRLWSLSSDHAYGESRVQLQPLEITCSAYEGRYEAAMDTRVAALDGWSAPTVAYLAWSETLGATIAFTTDRAVDALYAEHAELGVGFSIISILGAQLMSTVQAGFAAPIFDSAGDVWVVTPEGQTTRYENYDYTGFAKHNGRQYGVKADGVYLLDGQTDNGLPIQAAIGLGKQDFGTTRQKSVVAAYLGVSSTSKMFLKIVANGREYVYAARQSSEVLKAQRVDPGKGFKATLMDFIVYNSDGADFELSSVEFTAIALGRRI
jgi:hypothetical protein